MSLANDIIDETVAGCFGGAPGFAFAVRPLDADYALARAIRRTKRPIRTRTDTRLLSEQVATMERQIRRLEARVREITGDP
jgi:hypothetical protein